MFHTHLSREKGESKSGYDLSRFDWSKYDLVVIDESHNFRNKTEKDEGFTRYQRLIQSVIKESKNTKVLLLSATPVNNSLADLRNQLYLITADKDDALEEYGINSIKNLLGRARGALNRWAIMPTKRKEELYDMLPPKFFKLLEMMTIARSRKHITTCYGTDKIGTFPEKLKPDTYTPHIDVEKCLLNFKTTNMRLEELKLAVYMPLSYVHPIHKPFYREKYKTTWAGLDVFYHEDREFITAKMHRFNLFKRLDSSVYAFAETLRRLLEKIDSYIEDIENGEFNPSTDDYDVSEGDTCLDYKYEIKVEHLDQEKFLMDLYFDKEQIEEIVALQIKGIQKMLENNGVTLKMSDAAIRFLANAGYDPEFGARPVKRAIQKYLLNDLSKKMLAQEVSRTQPIFVEATGDGLTFKN